MDEKYQHNELELPGLEAMKEHTEQLAVPRGINEAILNGMYLGRKRRRHRMMTRMIAFTGCLLILVTLASIRFSPVVAAYVSDIPGLRSFVQLISYDKGLQLALESDFMQPVGLSDEHDGVKLMVDGILADESRIVVFYTLNNIDGRKRVINLVDAKLANNKDISLSYGSFNFNEDWDNKQGTIELNLHDGIEIPDTLDLRLKVGKEQEKTEDRPVWQIVVPVDKEKFEGLKETYDINQTVIVEGQRIHFGTMTIYPTRIGLEVDYDPANTKKIFSFDDIRIEDEQGETFGTITNGISGSIKDDNRQVLYFQSNYFHKPSQLYLRASSIRALDKGKLEVLVDHDNMQLLSHPDNMLTLDLASNSEEKSRKALVFHLKSDDPMDENRGYNLFENNYKDGTGQSFEWNKTEWNSSGDLYYYLEKGDYLSPLKFTISDYPSRIRGDINLRIK